MSEQYALSDKIKKISIGLIIVGIISLIASFFVYAGGDHGAGRIWANMLLNNVYFLGIALAAAFFIAASYVANAGWHVVIKRVPEAMMGFIPFAGLLMIPVLIFGMHDIYHWTHEELYDRASGQFDPIMEDKRPYLNTLFFVIRFVIYFVLWTFLTYLLRQNSLREDIEGGMKYYKRSITISAIFLVIFAVTSAMASWDWLMSIDPHWYSTLYGWYVFASIFVSSLAFITLIIIYLKKQGLLKMVTDEHLHDLGKFIFAFSIFWTYLWFCQFLLIWYGNIPEETVYFKERLDNFRVVFFTTFAINFFIPFLVLMTRNAKRRLGILTFVAIMVLIGHWLDFYQMIMPGALGEEAGFGFLEIGLTLGYLGLFILITGWGLSKAYLVPKNHPYLEESIHHQT